MESSRFFVANLPANTKEKDLRSLFQDYGAIKNIELKTKDNLVDSDVKVIAFVTLNIGADDANYCLKDLNWQKINGQQIKVSLAKESFLERLKREREDAKAVCDGTQAVAYQPEEEQSELLRAPKQNKRKTFDVDAELDDDDVPIELMITKKRAATSMHNGKIVIQSQDVQPIHVIDMTKKKHKPQLDDKSNSADQKRKESLNKKKNQYQQQKSAIQQALQGMDSGKKSNKIKFSDAESDPEEQIEPEPSKKAKTNIFGSDDEDDENIQFKTMPTGKKGEKLIKMQAKQSLDPRFRIDAKFVEDDDEDDDEDKNQTNDNRKVPEDDERQWQMNILEQVVGTKLDSVKNPDKSHKNKKMLRYDPSKDEHQKFERSKEEQSNLKKAKQSKIKEKAAPTPTEAPAEVSKEVFYVVTDTLQESLRTRGEGFSLLNMFGHSDQLEQRDEQLKQLGNEKILVNNNKLEKSFAANPFTYDSSSESETEEQQEAENSVSKSNEVATAPKKTKNKLKFATESFFIPKNDKRLKEGSTFFIYKKADDAPENYEEVRNRLKIMIKTKITKTKKSLANAGYKIKRKV